jgi:hypothetical protein
VTVYPEAQTLGNQWPRSAEPMSHEDFHPRGQVADYSKWSPFVIAGLEQQKSSFSADEVAILSELRRNFVMQGEASVVAFLGEHAGISQVLSESVNPLKTFFGPDTIVTLRVRSDEVGIGTLYAVAMWPKDVQSARDSLARFDDWWTTCSRRASGRLAFTYELV